MKDNLLQLQTDALKAFSSASTDEALYALEVEYLGRKGKLTALLKGIKDLSLEDKKLIGKLGNEVKHCLLASLEEHATRISTASMENLGSDFFDTTLPGISVPAGRMHPLSRMIQDIEDVFISMGFDVAEGPDIEDDYHCFTALNIPEDHPARDMQDTLWIADIPKLVRTHTSSVQIRYMENHPPPIRIICPGAAYRKDDIDATHSPHFHQFEGLMIDKKTNLSHLKGVLTTSLRALIHPELELRFRTSFFPFVEPGIEVDVTCVMCEGKGCPVCKRSGWLELLGAGMVHPNVLKSVGIDSDVYQGFAFGCGIERVLMIKHRINDIRLFYENDPRFLSQF